MIRAGEKLNIACLIIGGCLISLLFLLRFGSLAAAEETPSLLQEDDCGKCHELQVKNLAADGGKHGTEVSCLDCHPEHLPKGKQTKVPCTQCHEGQPHFQIEDCLDCHADPHRPLASLRDTMKSARQECLSCHAEVGQKMEEAPSRHAGLSCNNCHERHGYIPSCLDCHQPHLAEQTGADCSKCHHAHQPRQVQPVGHIPSTFCQVCHAKEAHDLAATTTNHGSLNCAYCHKGLHPSIPQCQDCHGLPHATVIHSQHSRCLDCHMDAHRLINNP